MIVKARKVRRIDVIPATHAVLDGSSQYCLIFLLRSHAFRKRLKSEAICVCSFLNFIANLIGLSTDGEGQSGIPGNIANTIGLLWLKQFQKPWMKYPPFYF